MSKKIIAGTMLTFLVVNSLLGMAFGWWAFAAGVMFIAFVTCGITVILKMVNGNKPAKGLVVTTILSLLLSICFLLLGISGAKKAASRHEGAGTGVVEVVKYIPNPLYDMYWEIITGPKFHGRSKVADDERVVERLNADDPSRLDFNQKYWEDGIPQVMRIRGERIAEGRWKGTWDQDRPKAQGTFFLNSDGTNSFTGGLTFEWGENKSAATLTIKPVN